MFSNSDVANLSTNPCQDVLTSCIKSAQRLLLSVGSGDGSQQMAIVKEGHRNILVTFYDTKEQLLKKYPHTKDVLKFLNEKCTHRPMYGVDATQLHRYKDSLGPFDLIFFTFPHTGIPNKSSRSTASNQKLLRGFLRSSLEMLKSNGEIQITLKKGSFYDSWNVESIANEIDGLFYKRSYELDKALFPGYKHRLTTGMRGSLKEVAEPNGSMVHIFTSMKPNGKGTHRRSLIPYAGRLFIAENETSMESVTNMSMTYVDSEIEGKIIECLATKEKNGNPVSRSVLEIRRSAFNTPALPDTRVMNRILYQMHKQGKIKKHSPNGSNKKPLWSLIKP